MKPPRFSYLKPETVAEAVDFLGSHGAETKLLAGGQSLMPALNMRLVRPQYLLDLNGIHELDYVRYEKGRVTVGAMVRQDSLMHSDAIKEHWPLVPEALQWVGHSAIRYRGTLGGSLVHSDPAAELPAVMVTLGAEIIVRGSQGERKIMAEDFFETYFTTAISSNEILVAVTAPAQPANSGSSVLEIARRHGDFALAGIVTLVEVAEGKVSAATITAFGLDEAPKRLGAAEAALTGQVPTPELLGIAGEIVADSVQPEDDIHATAAYRREMASVLTGRSLSQSLERAGISVSPGEERQ